MVLAVFRKHPGHEHTHGGDLRRGDKSGGSIDDLVLDAGYITRELITAYNAYGRFVSFTRRMPARKGFPFWTLCHRCGGSIHQAKYFFDRNGHTYFGRRF